MALKRHRLPQYFWIGKLPEHPEIMTQGETREELGENIKDAYRMVVLEDVPEKHQMKQSIKKGSKAPYG